MVNLELLVQQFTDAGIVNVFPDSDGGLSWNELATPQEIAQAEAIVAAHNPNELTKQQEIDQARAALQAGKLYLQKQLASASPHTLTQLVSNMKPAVDGNTFLLRMVENKIDVMSVAFGWTAADVKTPETAPNDNALNRSRYIEAVMQIIALLA